MLWSAVRWRSRNLLFVLWWCLLRFSVISNTTSTVYFRQQSGGSIFAIDRRDGSETETEGSSEYARFVGLAIHRRYGRIFWSDGRSVESANLSDGSDVNVVIGALARVVWIGSNFGQTQVSIHNLTVKGTRRNGVISWSPERVECIVGRKIVSWIVFGHDLDLGRIIIQAYIYTRRSQTNIRFIYQR